MAYLKTGIRSRKLTADDVREIRTAYADPESTLTEDKLAKMYKVSRSTIHCILARKTWKEVE